MNTMPTQPIEHENATSVFFWKGEEWDRRGGGRVFGVHDSETGRRLVPLNHADESPTTPPPPPLSLAPPSEYIERARGETTGMQQCSCVVWETRTLLPFSYAV